MTAAQAPDSPAGAINDAVGAEIAKAAHSVCAQFAVDGVVPAVVVLPESAEQVALALSLASQRGWAVIPWGSGSGMACGNPPRRYDLALSLRHMAQVVDHDVDNLTLTAQAGLSVAEANRLLQPHNQLLAIAHGDAPRTLGGLIAANPVVPRRLIYGDLRDQLLGVRVALPDGSLVRYGRKVIKNVAGYDMNKLLLGSRGMLGVVVEAIFKLSARPDGESGLAAVFADQEQAAACAGALYGTQLQPSYLWLLDGKTAMAAQPGALRGGGAPDPAGGAALCVGFEGRRVALQRQVADGARLVAEHRGSELARYSEPSPALLAALQAEPAEQAEPGVRLRLGVRPTDLAALLPTVRAGLDALALAHRLSADYGAGQLHVHLLEAPAGHAVALAGWIDGQRKTLAQKRGFLVVEAAPRSLKDLTTPWGAETESMAGEAAVMEMLRSRIDPHGIMAPGRYL